MCEFKSQGNNDIDFINCPSALPLLYMELYVVFLRDELIW